MILDKLSLFVDNEVVANAHESDILDLRVDPGYKMPKRDIGKGRALPLLIQVTEDYNNLTSMKVDIETSETQDFASTTVLASSEMVAADMVAGAQFPLRYMPTGNERYVRLKFTVTGTAPTTGKITAGFVHAHNDRLS